MAKLISVIIPVYNEAESLPFLWAEFQKVSTLLSSYDFEFVFINDGSTDNSAEVIKDLAASNPNIKYLELSRNFGKEIATTAGFNYAQGEAVIMIDADLQHPPRLIPEFIKKWEAGAEVIIGVRQKNKGEGIIKKLGSFLFYKLINRIAAIKIVPAATDFRLLDRKVVTEFNKFTERNRMTRALINWLGFKRDFIYFEADARLRGKASYSFIKLAKLALSSFISLSLLPLKLAGYLGCSIIFFAGSFGFYLLLGRYIFEWSFALSFTGTAELAILLVFLVGIILSSLGLMALYIASIHGEVINRPLYVIRDKKNI